MAAMRVTRHTPTLVRMTRLGFVNAYLVLEDDGLTLVDTMVAGSAGGILEAARDLGAPIVRVVLTHMHGDHVGSLDAVAARLPDAAVLMTARDARILAGDRTPDPGEPESKLKGSVPKRLRTRPTRTVAPGDLVGSLRVVAAPGHTPGQLALIDERDRTLIAADAYSTLGGVETSARVNPRFPLPALATWDRPTALRTAEALRALDPARLAVGHGDVVEAPGAAMDAAIARAAMRR
jgi:glyoxylase-like metal-dependent hydrolase (beta-lactamase superfamily II)